MPRTPAKSGTMTRGSTVMVTRRRAAEARKAGRAVYLLEELPNQYGKRQRKQAHVATANEISLPSDVSQWSTIANDLLVDILGRLHTLGDFFAFRGVCKHWRNVASTSDPALLSSQSPLEVVTGRRFDAVYDFISRRRYSLRLPWKFPNRHSISYSHGFLITVGPYSNPYVSFKCRSPSSIHLWDIFTGATTILPTHPKGFSRIIVSARPDSARCQVVLCAGFSDTVQYLNVGDTSWNVVSSEDPFGIRAMVFFQGELLALTSHMELVAVELTGVSLRRRKLGGRGVVGTSSFLDIWLGESDGVLLAVCQHYTEKAFRIFRWNLDNKGWDEIQDLGDKALFAGGWGYLASISSTGLGIKKNCVYASNCKRSGWGEFSLEDGSYKKVKIEYPRFNVRKTLYPSPVWVFPNHC